MRGNQFTHDGNGDVPWCFLHEESEFACGDNAVHVSNRKCFVVKVLSGRFQFIVVAWDYSDVIDLVRADDQFSVGPICSRNERNILFIPLRCQPGFDNSPHYLLTALRPTDEGNISEWVLSAQHIHPEQTLESIGKAPLAPLAACALRSQNSLVCSKRQM